MKNRGSTHEGGKDDDKDQEQVENRTKEPDNDDYSSANSTLTDHSLEHKFHQNNLYAIHGFNN